jgi:cytochrome c556
MILEDGAAPQAVLERYVALGKACGACHDRYREPNT